jgi:transcriptional regulator with XRE-family HTH domain
LRYLPDIFHQKAIITRRKKMTSIGERIVFLREERNMSQKELAQKLNITAATLSRYENNIYEPKVVFLHEMCKVLNTTADFLLGLTDVYQRPSDPEQIRLTTQERRLLNYYRLLTTNNKIRITERAQTLLELQKEDTKQR